MATPLASQVMMIPLPHRRHACNRARGVLESQQWNRINDFTTENGIIPSMMRTSLVAILGILFAILGVGLLAFWGSHQPQVWIDLELSVFYYYYAD